MITQPIRRLKAVNNKNAFDVASLIDFSIIYLLTQKHNRILNTQRELQNAKRETFLH
jgi:glycerol-3-phosphate responsive antiterminator